MGNRYVEVIYNYRGELETEIKLWKPKSIKIIDGGVGISLCDGDGFTITAYLNYKEVCELVNCICNQEAKEGVEANE